ncbi:hypothetical protein HXX76_008230 [Chlamydomonas incerta]|uniref:TRP C-terminal domain-containing protein n=1 Tax=Chlamydomonas incerta TaxID=51695 RepID=A0A835SYM6_CHLIN|nr:hypothetical protein HXX76_008230 [Chlamydomonas incerta]|eukprot:KAG2433877.1 hypothetical protein HXX76_008230 [Chlamydomonas incerta]
MSSLVVRGRNTSLSFNSAWQGGAAYVAGTFGMDAFEVTDGAVVQGNVADNGSDGEGGVLQLTRGMFSPYPSSLDYMLVARDARVVNNLARGGGGVVHVSDTYKNVTITDGAVLEGNSAPGASGGALWYESYMHSLFITNGGRAVNNSAAAYGGFAYVRGWMSGVLVAAGGLLTGNSARDEGGAIYGEMTLGSFTADSADLSGNAAISGAVVYVVGGMDAVTLRNGTTVRGNAAGYGGVFYSPRIGNVSVTTGSVVTGNRAAVHGAVQYASQGVEAVEVAAGSSVTENRAEGSGGVLYIEGAQGAAAAGDTGSGSGGSGLGRLAVSGGSRIEQNAAGLNGGVLWAPNVDNITLAGGAVVGGNSAEKADGGAVAAAVIGRLRADGGSRFEGNTAGRHGGALHTEAGVVQMELGGGSYFTRNAALKGSGGAVHVAAAQPGTKLQWRVAGGSGLIENTAGGAGSMGGAVAVGAAATVQGSGGVAAAAAAPCVLELGMNGAESADDGSRSIDGSSSTAGRFVNNSVLAAEESSASASAGTSGIGGAGGALAITGCRLRIDGGRFDGNRAAGGLGSGGAVYVSTGTAAVAAAAADGRRLLQQASATSAPSPDDPSLQLEGSSFVGNSAQIFGGAVAVAGGGVSLSARGCSFNANSVTARDGGSVAAGSGCESLTLANCSISSSTALGGGGGLSVRSCGRVLLAETLNGNKASRGGALQLLLPPRQRPDLTVAAAVSTSVVLVASSTFTSNTAVKGCLPAATNGSSSSSSSSATAVAAPGDIEGHGGALFVSDGAGALLLTGTAFAANRAWLGASSAARIASVMAALEAAVWSGGGEAAGGGGLGCSLLAIDAPNCAATASASALALAVGGGSTATAACSEEQTSFVAAARVWAANVDPPPIRTSSACAEQPLRDDASGSNGGTPEGAAEFGVGASFCVVSTVPDNGAWVAHIGIAVAAAARAQQVEVVEAGVGEALQTFACVPLSPAPNASASPACSEPDAVVRISLTSSSSSSNRTGSGLAAALADSGVATWEGLSISGWPGDYVLVVRVSGPRPIPPIALPFRLSGCVVGEALSLTGFVQSSSSVAAMALAACGVCPRRQVGLLADPRPPLSQAACEGSTTFAADVSAAAAAPVAVASASAAGAAAADAAAVSQIATTLGLMGVLDDRTLGLAACQQLWYAARGAADSANTSTTTGQNCTTDSSATPPQQQASALPACAVWGAVSSDAAGSYMQQQCAEGYTGNLCAVCQTGYTPNLDFACEPCAPQSRTLGIAFMSLVFNTAVVVYVAATSLGEESDEGDGAAKEAGGEQQADPEDCEAGRDGSGSSGMRRGNSRTKSRSCRRRGGGAADSHAKPEAPVVTSAGDVLKHRLPARHDALRGPLATVTGAETYFSYSHSCLLPREQQDGAGTARAQLLGSLLTPCVVVAVSVGVWALRYLLFNQAVLRRVGRIPRHQTAASAWAAAELLPLTDTAAAAGDVSPAQAGGDTSTLTSTDPESVVLLMMLTPPPPPALAPTPSSVSNADDAAAASQQQHPQDPLTPQQDTRDGSNCGSNGSSVHHRRQPARSATDASGSSPGSMQRNGGSGGASQGGITSEPAVASEPLARSRLAHVDESLGLAAQCCVVLLVGVFVLYPAWAQAAFSVFACKLIDTPTGGGGGGSGDGVPGDDELLRALEQATHAYGYWAHNMNQECYSGTHAAFYVPIGVVSVCLFCVAPPITTFVLLWRVRHSLNEFHTRQVYGFIYSRYRPRLWGWDSALQLQTLALVAVDVFGRGLLVAYQALLLLAVLLVIGAVNILVCPVRAALLQRLEFLSFAVLSLTIPLSLYFAVGDNELVDGPEGVAIFALIITINVGTLFAFACVMLANSWGALVEGWGRLTTAAVGTASSARHRWLEKRGLSRGGSS